MTNLFSKKEFIKVGNDEFEEFLKGLDAYYLMAYTTNCPPVMAVYSDYDHKNLVAYKKIYGIYAECFIKNKDWK